MVVIIKKEEIVSPYVLMMFTTTINGTNGLLSANVVNSFIKLVSAIHGGLDGIYATTMISKGGGGIVKKQCYFKNNKFI